MLTARERDDLQRLASLLCVALTADAACAGLDVDVLTVGVDPVPALDEHAQWAAFALVRRELHGRARWQRTTAPHRSQRDALLALHVLLAETEVTP